MRAHGISLAAGVLMLLGACDRGSADRATTAPSAAPPAGAVGLPPQGTQPPAANPPAVAEPSQSSQTQAGQAGQGATVPAAGSGGPAVAGAPAVPDDVGMQPAAPDATGEPSLALDECGLDSGFPGDEYCILPPPPDKGFQIHIGPADYADPGVYLMQPGDESTEDFSAVTGNDGEIYYYRRQYRMRPGSHHLIVSEAGAQDAVGGRRLGGSQNVAKDNPEGGVIAPENEGIGMPLSAHAPVDVQLHYINVSSEPLLREAWINFWYVDPATVTQRANEMFANGGLGMNIPASTDTVLGPYSCPITQAGRVLTMYGHRHANAPRFSAWRVRGGVRELVYESLDWAEPIVLEFNSVTTNPAPDRANGLQGGFSGILDLMPGDTLEWECEVRNTHDFALRFGNQTYDSEMCILIGDTVGPTVSCQFF